MKKFLAVSLLSFLAVLGTQAQSSTSFTITVQAPPSCVVALAPNPVSASGTRLYSGQAGTLVFNISACASASALATATWDGAATPTVFVASPAALSVPVTVAQATVGTHTLVLTIPQPVLAMTSPVTLPNGKVGTAFSTNLATSISGGLPPYSFSLDPTTPLPPGLSLSQNGLVTGTPVSSGFSSFNFTVTDGSVLARRFVSTSTHLV